MSDAINRKYAMTPLAAGVIAALNPSNPAVAQESEGTKALDEITVTATRRELSLQDVGQSITAFSNEDLAEMGVRSMTEYIKAMPSVALTETRPGVSSLSMRGISGGSFEYRLLDQTTIYLDEQAMTTSAQNISVRPIDMHHVETLPGPQGTLFGASSQTGTLRLISNKPDFSEFSGMIQTDLGTTSGGSESYDISGVLNFPITDNFAVRAVGYTTLDGGYVDNIYGETYSGNFDNSEYVKDDYNEYETTGGRVSALWQISDSWDILATVVTESSETVGEWETDPSLGGDRIVRFFEDFYEDDWVSFGMTLTGDLGFASLSVTGQYMDRDFAYEWDNNAYTQRKDRVYGGAYRNAYRDCVADYGYYACAYAGYYAGYSYAGRYYTNYSFSTIRNDQTQEREQVEIRLTSQGDGKLQWMLGGYYEEVYDEWFYRTYMPNHLNTTAWAFAQAYAYYYNYNGYNVQYPLTDTLYHYVQTMERTNTQIAIFGEMDYDLTDKTTLTLGGRWVDNERDEFDRYEWPEGLSPIGGLDTAGVYGTSGSSSDTLFKVGLKHRINEDKMVYALFSQGLRPGGSNSPRAASSGSVPREYEPDYMDNYEIGIKSQWADNTFQFNGSLFMMKWSDVHDSIFGLGQWWIRGTTNARTAESVGFEFNFQWQVSDNLSFQGNYFQADATFTKPFYNPDSGDLLVRQGQDMANSPDNAGWIALSYDIPDVLGGDMWFWYDMSFGAERWNTTGSARDEDPGGLAPAWTWHNAQVGFNWENDLSLTLKVNNLFDQRAPTYIASSIRSYSNEFPDGSRDRFNGNGGRPRTVWLSLRKDF
ncbi:MAG: TonB-dependent receptor [Woeseiaceae bacterium]